MLRAFRWLIILGLIAVCASPALGQGEEPPPGVPFYEVLVTDGVGNSGASPYGILIDVPQVYDQTALQINELRLTLLGGSVMLWRGDLVADTAQLEQALNETDFQTSARRRPEAWNMTLTRGVVKLEITSPDILAANGGVPFTTTLVPGMRVNYDRQQAVAGQNPFALAPMLPEDLVNSFALSDSGAPDSLPRVLSQKEIDLIQQAQPILNKIGGLSQTSIAAQLLLGPVLPPAGEIVAQPLEGTLPQNFIEYVVTQTNLDPAQLSDLIASDPGVTALVMDNLTAEPGVVESLQRVAAEDPSLGQVFASLVLADPRAVDLLVASSANSEPMIEQFFGAVDPAVTAAIVDRLTDNPGARDVATDFAETFPTTSDFLLQLAVQAPDAGGDLFASIYSDSETAEALMLSQLGSGPDKLVDLTHVFSENAKVVALMVSAAAEKEAALPLLTTILQDDAAAQQFLDVSQQDAEVFADVRTIVEQPDGLVTLLGLANNTNLTGGAVVFAGALDDNPGAQDLLVDLVATDPAVFTAAQNAMRNSSAIAGLFTQIAANTPNNGQASVAGSVPEVAMAEAPPAGDDVPPVEPAFEPQPEPPVSGDQSSSDGNGDDDDDSGGPPPPVDTDHDGFPDSSDDCPTTSGTINGCPPGINYVGQGGPDPTFAAPIGYTGAPVDNIFYFDNASTGYWAVNGNGTETLDFSAVTLFGINIDLGSSMIGQSQNIFGSLFLLLMTPVENVIGTDQADMILGSTEANMIEGGGGADTITGGGGGDDFILGGAGDDLITDLSGSLNVEGGAGDDTIEGTATGSSTIIGGSLNDSDSGADDGDDSLSIDVDLIGFAMLSIAGGNANTAAGGNDGSDTLSVNVTGSTASPFALQITGGNINDGVTGNDGSDSISLTGGGLSVVSSVAVYGGNINFNGGGNDVGEDTISYDYLYGSGDATIFGGNNNVASDGVAALEGSDQGDNITLGPNASGNEGVYGGNRNQIAGGSFGINGDDGDDTITDQSSGDDTIHGGNLNLPFTLGIAADGNDGDDSITLTSTSDGKDYVYGGNQNVGGGSADFPATGTDGSDTIIDNSLGGDRIFGGNQNTGVGADGDDAGGDSIRLDNQTVTEEQVYGGNYNTDGGQGDDTGSDTLTNHGTGIDVIAGGNLNDGAGSQGDDASDTIVDDGGSASSIYGGNVNQNGGSGDDNVDGGSDSITADDTPDTPDTMYGGNSNGIGSNSSSDSCSGDAGDSFADCS